MTRKRVLDVEAAEAKPTAKVAKKKASSDTPVSGVDQRLRDAQQESKRLKAELLERDNAKMRAEMGDIGIEVDPAWRERTEQRRERMRQSLFEGRLLVTEEDIEDATVPDLCELARIVAVPVADPKKPEINRQPQQLRNDLIAIIKENKEEES